MFLPMPYDPSIHTLYENDVTRAWRRDTGFKNLVTFRNRLTDVYVVGLRSHDGGELIELDSVDGESGTSMTPSRQQYRKIVQGLTAEGISPKQARMNLRSKLNDQRKTAIEGQAQFDEARGHMARHVRERFGNVAYERMIHALGFTPKTASTFMAT